MGVKTKFGGGGGVLKKTFFRKTILSRFTFYAIFNIKKNILKSSPSLNWLNGRWFLQIVDHKGQLESISIISSIPLFWFCISNVGVVWGGGGVMFFSYFMLFTTFLETFFFLRKTIISHLMFSSCFLCWKYWSSPSFTIYI